jgi:hypothetical protein
MATISGFQSNTTIHAAFWIYRPDPSTDPVSQEEFIEVNSIQRIAANAAVILGSVSGVQVASGLLTVAVPTTAQMRVGQLVIFSGLTNATFLNGQVVWIKSLTPTTLVGDFAHTDYGSTPEVAGSQVIDATSRTVYLYYAETSVSTSQAPRKLDGGAAARFIYDMEQLFS